MIERVECIVIGAGVVGLAVARALAQAGREVVVLEKENAFGTGISSRNSEVIHSGLYYAPGALKTRLCLRGKALLYDYCARHGITHRRCGKLIVATDAAQMAKLEDLAANARRVGLDDVEPLSAAQAQALEPALSCVGALWSPSTGIIDSHGLMLALLGDAEAHGAALALMSPVTAGRVERDGIVLQTGGAQGMTVKSDLVVNCGGLDAQHVAGLIAGVPATAVARRRLAKGNYFTLQGRAPFSRLIYPVPEPGGLGVHLTLDTGGQARFGPDVEWIDAIDYRVDPRRADGFYGAVRRYWPALPDGALQPGYAGIRPKVVGSGGDGFADFIVSGPADHGVSGLVQLFGIESPGLTASLAIAELVVALGAA